MSTSVWLDIDDVSRRRGPTKGNQPRVRMPQGTLCAVCLKNGHRCANVPPAGKHRYKKFNVFGAHDNLSVDGDDNVFVCYAHYKWSSDQLSEMEREGRVEIETARLLNVAPARGDSGVEGTAASGTVAGGAASSDAEPASSAVATSAAKPPAAKPPAAYSAVSLLCSKGCGRTFGWAPARATHERSCRGDPLSAAAAVTAAEAAAEVATAEAAEVEVASDNGPLGAAAPEQVAPEELEEVAVEEDAPSASEQQQQLSAATVSLRPGRSWLSTRRRAFAAGEIVMAWRVFLARRLLRKLRYRHQRSAALCLRLLQRSAEVVRARKQQAIALRELAHQTYGGLPARRETVRLRARVKEAEKALALAQEENAERKQEVAEIDRDNARQQDEAEQEELARHEEMIIKQRRCKSEGSRAHVSAADG